MILVEIPWARPIKGHGVKDVRSETRRTPATEFVAATHGSWARFCPSAPVSLEEEEERV